MTRVSDQPAMSGDLDSQVGPGTAYRAESRRPRSRVPVVSDLVPRNRDFTIYWGSQSVSMLGDSFTVTAFPLLVLQTSGSVTQMGAMVAVASIAMIVAGLFAGSIVDRMEPRMIIFACDVVRGALNLLIPLSWLTGPHISLLYSVAIVGAAAGALFRVAHTKMITKLVDREHFLTANGLSQGAAGGAYVMGPAMAGAIAATLGLTVAIGLNGVSFVLSAIGTLFITTRGAPGAQAGDTAVGNDRVRGFLAGISFLRHQLVLRRLLVLQAVMAMLTYGLVNVFIYHLRHDLHQPYGTVGLMLGGAATGAVIAAVAASRLRSRFGFAACWSGSYLVAGLAIAGLGITTDIAAMWVIAAGFAFGTSLGLVCTMSLQQEMTPRHLLGRTTSIFTTVELAFGAAGVIVLTRTVGSFGTRPVAVVVGVTLAAVAAGSLLAPARNRGKHSRPTRLATALRSLLRFGHVDA
jgi:MFS family permease